MTLYLVEWIDDDGVEDAVRCYTERAADRTARDLLADGAAVLATVRPIETMAAAA